jgi:dipeptidyl aminopeptidase/acylaminoacyl peptidase
MLSLVASSAAAASSDTLAVAFGARPAVSQVSLSPDGKRVAFVTPLPGQGSALFVVGTSEGAEPKRVAVATGDPERLAACRWANTVRLVCLIYGQKAVADPIMAPGGAWGRPFESLVALSADGGDGVHPAKQVALGVGEVIDWLPDEHDEVMISDRSHHNIVTGQQQPAERLGIGGVFGADFFTDGLGTVRVAATERIHSPTGLADPTTNYFYRDVGATAWKPLSTTVRATGAGFRPLAIDPKANEVWGLRKVGGRYAVFTKKLDDAGLERQVFADPDVDVDELVRIGRRQRIVGVRYVTDRTQVHYTDAGLASLAEQLARALPSTPKISIVDASDDENTLLILAASDTDPGRYYVLDRAARRLQVLMQVRPQLDGMKLAPVKVVHYPAPDGTVIPAYLTLPVGQEQPGRAIVLPHGGPSARDEWGFDWLAQFFAARGFAVLQPNFRGSSGYGDQFLADQGFRQWRTAVGDIDAGARWLVQQHIASAQRLAIFGWSYGGYAALQAAATEPDLYRAVVAVAPVTDLTLTRRSVSRSSYRKELFEFIGDEPQGEASPVNQAAHITAPVMLVHGTFDLNVPYDHSQRMTKRLMAAGHPPMLLTFPRLDHQLDDAAARTKLLEEADKLISGEMPG